MEDSILMNGIEKIKYFLRATGNQKGQNGPSGAQMILAALTHDPGLESQDGSQDKRDALVSRILGMHSTRKSGIARTEEIWTADT